MNKKQAARARRRAAKPEPNMPTVDELVEIAKYGMTKTHAEAYEKWKAMQEAAPDQTSFYGPGMASLIYNVEPTARKSASNNIPKPKDPTYDHKPRKIVLE